jgi:Zn finger protein HypA/HybF involved in hydrogenase expression
MRKEKYSKELLTPLILSSKTFSDVVRTLSGTEKVHGGMVAYIKKMAEKHKIDFNHFNKSVWNKGLKGSAVNKMTLENLMCYLSSTPTKRTCNSNLKKWLFEFKLKENKCEGCTSNDLWMGKLLVLQLDHIDGNNLNNELSNLRILCPNCHSQTLNYAGRKNTK